MAAGKHTKSSIRRAQAQAGGSAAPKNYTKAGSSASRSPSGASAKAGSSASRSRSNASAKAKAARRAKAKQTVGILVVLLLVIFCAGAMWYGIREGNRYIAGDRIYPNVSVGGVSLGGLTREQGARALRNAGYESAGAFTVRVVLSQDNDFTLRSDEIGYGRSAASAARLAWEYGRTIASPWGRLYALASCWLKPVSLTGESADTFDDNAVLETIRDACAAANIDGVDAAYQIDGDTLLVTKGVTGVYADVAEIYQSIRQALAMGEDTEIDYSPHLSAPVEVSLEAVWNNVNKAPVSARYDGATQTVLDAAEGITFDLEAAQGAYDSAAEGSQVAISLVHLEPEVTAPEIQAMLFRDVVGQATTSMATSSAARINNITLAASACNGTVLQPGETFSFNGVVGRRTAAGGYQAAGAYINGETVDTIGGGICQCSSTIYYCVLQAGLEVTDRVNHMYRVSYLPLAMDATVSWGSLDFQFKNNTAFPLRIEAAVDQEAKTLHVELVGTRTEPAGRLVSVRLTEIPFTTGYFLDPSLGDGNRYTKTSGYNAYVADSYYFWEGSPETAPEDYYPVLFRAGTVIQYMNGTEIVQETLEEDMAGIGFLISRDSYRKRDKVVVVGSITMVPEGATLVGSAEVVVTEDEGGETVSGEELRETGQDTETPPAP